MKKTTVVPEPFLYQDFQQALTSLKSALTNMPTYALLLGDSGSGKTTLLRTLAAKLDRRRFQVLYLCHGRPSPSGLARVLAEALHLPLRRTRAETSRLLVQTLRNLPTRLLFWIDEAQLIGDDTLHEIRLLAEADLDGPPLFSVLLSALPELKDRLLAPHLFPLWRRIRPKVSLTGLRREELALFLAHSLGKEIPARFEDAALSALFEQARGLPALVTTFSEECIKTCPKGVITPPQVADVMEHIEGA
ncbi:MAG: AAA family ATPase [Planctomycetota bacterium]